MKQITAVLIGAGNRGQTYANLMNDGRFRIVAVAEPVKEPREYIRDMYDIPEDKCFLTWETLLKEEKMADIAIITTVDGMHYEPAMLAMKLGYDLLLEKPAAPTEMECAELSNLAGELGRKVLVCHVLRYTPFFSAIKGLIREGRLGRVMSVHHCECVGHIHQSHSFVRGNWCNTAESTNMLLAKSCHDIDIIQWLVGEECTRAHSFGSLTYFCEKNAPEGAPERCIDGCPHGETCHYNAVKLYLEDEENMWFRTTSTKMVNPTNADVEHVLRTTRYGKCVFRCDNDVVDHQVVNMEFEGGAVASYNMCAFNKGGRFIRVMGTEGEVYGDMDAGTLNVYSFALKTNEIFTPTEIVTDGTVVGGHGGGDEGIVDALYRYIAEGYQGDMLSEIGISVRNHLTVFAAEESRINGTVVDVREFAARYLR